MSRLFCPLGYGNFLKNSKRDTATSRQMVVKIAAGENALRGNKRRGHWVAHPAYSSQLVIFVSGANSHVTFTSPLGVVVGDFH